jgi:hypothetical protein
MEDEETILALLVLALVGFLGWWWWRSRGWSPMPGESSTTPGATQAQWAPADYVPGAPVVFKYAPVAAVATVGREWAPGYDDGKRGTVSVTYTNKPLGFA